jgi:hypothetical protein
MFGLKRLAVFENSGTLVFIFALDVLIFHFIQATERKVKKKALAISGEGFLMTDHWKLITGIMPPAHPLHPRVS